MYKATIDFIRSIYGQGPIPLHEPRFVGNEKKYVNDCIDSTFVSSVGEYVNRFEGMLCSYTGSPHAIAVVNGTAALHAALLISGVERGDEVLTQALTFVATANAISYIGAHPVFLDSSPDNLGMSAESLRDFLAEYAELRADGLAYNRSTGRRIKACVPMHVFGHPVDIDAIMGTCSRYNIDVIEDAAESLGSFSKGRHTGTIAPIGVLSFNGNKTVTCGGGGALLIRDKDLAIKAKHLTTTAKVPHKWDFFHDQVGFNYRLPNLNAALACAQMEFLPRALESKREIAERYRVFFEAQGLRFLTSPPECLSNYWLNALVLGPHNERNDFLEALNGAGIQARPLWKLMVDLPAFQACQTIDLANARFWEQRVVNLPSSPIV